jgi:hypothetical protein
MLEKIHGWDLIPGEFYFIQSPIPRASIGKGQMIRYININYDKVSGVFDTKFGKCFIEMNHWTLYRYVSNEEYKEKLREKYNDTCLNVVLKQVVNESFVW